MGAVVMAVGCHGGGLPRTRAVMDAVVKDAVVMEVGCRAFGRHGRGRRGCGWSGGVPPVFPSFPAYLKVAALLIDGDDEAVDVSDELIALRLPQAVSALLQVLHQNLLHTHTRAHTHAHTQTDSHTKHTHTRAHTHI